MRELIKAMSQLETQLQNRFGISSNEAMALCCISHDTLNASAIAETIGLTPSNTSKVLRTMENKSLVYRTLGNTDKRQMCFSLTPNGIKLLETIKNQDIEIPEFVRPLF